MGKGKEENTKSVQDKILQIFIAVKHICEKHHLRYFAIGGTCLGAVRHRGFIPWDDDLDIGMPDTDFLKFMEIAKVELPFPFELIPIGTLQNKRHLFAKVHDVTTTMIEKTEIGFSDLYKGIFIDIMPFCGIPSDKWKRAYYYKKTIILRALYYYSVISLDETHGTRQKFLRGVANVLSVFLPNRFFLKSWCKTVFKCSFDDPLNDRTAFLWSRNIFKLIFCKSWFESTVDMPFESTTIRCPTGWDQYLQAHFRDYMQLPPKTEQIPCHSGGIVDLRRPYTYYQEHGVEAK